MYGDIYYLPKDGNGKGRGQIPYSSFSSPSPTYPRYRDDNDSSSLTHRDKSSLCPLLIEKNPLPGLVPVPTEKIPSSYSLNTT